MSLQAKLEAIRQAVEAKNDVAYAALLLVVRQLNPYYANTSLPDGGYTTRNWDGLPPKALEGALAYGVERIWQRAMEASWLEAAGKLQNFIRVSSCTQEEACDAVLEALGMEAETTDA